MAAAHTRIPLPAAAWTSVYTAAGNKALTIGNVGNVAAKLRADASAASNDDLSSSGYLILNPGERFGLSVVSGDKVFASPVGTLDGAVSLLAQ